MARPTNRSGASNGSDVGGHHQRHDAHGVIDKDGNIFDVTPSGGWINGAVILGDTGIGMSVRGEQFWLDKTRANQIRPRARPRYTLTPSLVFKGDTPLMGLGTPGRRQPGSDHPAGVSQHRRILGRLVSQRASARSNGRACRPMHFYGSFWPHTPGFNRLGVEASSLGCRLQGAAESAATTSAGCARSACRAARRW